MGAIYMFLAIFFFACAVGLDMYRDRQAKQKAHDHIYNEPVDIRIQQAGYLPLYLYEKYVQLLMSKFDPARYVIVSKPYNGSSVCTYIKQPLEHVAEEEAVEHFRKYWSEKHPGKYLHVDALFLGREYLRLRKSVRDKYWPIYEDAGIEANPDIFQHLRQGGYLPNGRGEHQRALWEMGK